MYLKSSLFFSVAIALLQLTIAFHLGNHNSIAIKSRRDDTFLTALEVESSCHERGRVITTHNSTSYYIKGQEWELRIVHEDDEDERRFFILGEFDNEVTLTDKSHCEHVLAKYELIRVSRTSRYVQIKSIEKESCLTGNGDGQYISWENCRKYSAIYEKQVWHFSTEGADR